MSKEFKVPELGEGVETADVAKVLVSTGDEVEKDQLVVELETDKAAAEVPCDVAGTVDKVHIKEGDQVKVGQTLLTLGNGGTQEEEPEPEDEKEQDTEAQDKTRQQQKPRTREAQPEEEAAQKEPQETASEPEQAEPHDTQQESEEPATREATEEDTPEASENVPVPAAPSVRRFAREIGVDISQVKGSGPQGRISRDDVKAHAKSRSGSGGGRARSATLPDFSAWGETERQPMSKVRRLTADRMSRAWALAPQAVQFGRADLTQLNALRDRVRHEAEAAGGHLSLTVMLVKTLGAALKAFPRFNASVDVEQNDIVFKKYVNVGVAMDTERGLVVPVVRHVDTKTMIELSVEVSQLTEKARQGKLQAADMQGGNITLTNAGALGGDVFIPIVNWPEAAILGVAQSRLEAVYQGGELKPRPMLPLALSYDHRLIDGADGVRFMRWIVRALEDPVRLVVGGREDVDKRKGAG